MFDRAFRFGLSFSSGLPTMDLTEVLSRHSSRALHRSYLYLIYNQGLLFSGVSLRGSKTL